MLRRILEIVYKDIDCCKSLKTGKKNHQTNVAEDKLEKLEGKKLRKMIHFGQQTDRHLVIS